MAAVKREDWIDSCRFFAIFVIMLTHYLAKLLPEALRLWEELPGRLLLGGLTGKFSVAFFFVLLGYFASVPKKASFRGFGLYALRRYGQFAFFVFAVTLFYILGSYGCTWLFHSPDEGVLRVISDGPRYNLLYLLHDAFLLEDNYNPTLWCMRQLFLASLVCRLLGYCDGKLRLGLTLPVCLLSVLLGPWWIWIGVAALGVLLRALLELLPPLKKGWVLASLLLAVALIKQPLEEGLLLYSLQGLGAFFLLLAQFHWPPVQNALEAAPFPWLGRISMGLFVVHTPINSLLTSSVYAVLDGVLPRAIPLILCFVLSTALCIFAAWFLHRVYALLRRRREAVAAH